MGSIGPLFFMLPVKLAVFEWTDTGHSKKKYKYLTKYLTAAAFVTQWVFKAPFKGAAGELLGSALFMMLMLW